MVLYQNLLTWKEKGGKQTPTLVIKLGAGAALSASCLKYFIVVQHILTKQFTVMCCIIKRIVSQKLFSLQ